MHVEKSSNLGQYLVVNFDKRALLVIQVAVI
jgi:hypothetical protein